MTRRAAEWPEVAPDGVVWPSYTPATEPARDPFEVCFFVDGTPRPKARARVVRGRDGKVHGVTPASTRAWEQRVGLVARVFLARVRWRPVAAAYELDVEVHGSNLCSDIDNHAKAVLDALNGVAYPDDRCVVRLLVERCDGDLEGVRITIRRRAPKGEG